MRRTVATLGAIVLGVAALPPTAASAAPPTGPSVGDTASLAAGLGVAPKAPVGKAPAGPNPFLSLVADPRKADYAGWEKWLAANAAQKAKQRPGFTTLSSSPVVADEDEPAGTRGGNDTTATAQRINEFGTASGRNPQLRILGSLSPEAAAPVTVPATPEDDGSIPLAGDTGVAGGRNAVIVTAEIGDGPHAATGDFDFYKMVATAGQLLTVDVDTPTSTLDTVAAIYDSTGKVLASNDDNGAETDSLVRHVAPADGTYYAVVAGYGNLPRDPFDPTTGNGAGSKGAYTVTVSATRDDRDYYAVNLRKGDIIGATVKGSAKRISVYDPDGRERHGSDQDVTYVYPPTSPLPGGGNATTDHVAQQSGWHTVEISAGTGSYDATVQVYRAPLEDRKPVQTVFLDFDGAQVNTAPFNGPGVRQLSPLAAFLANWGLTRADEDALIDRIVDRVDENINNDLDESGINARFELKLTNSRDHKDTFGQQNVSRLIVGGTVAESGVNTIGIAQSVDPGNFATAETALILLDTLSAAQGDASLNTYLKPTSDRIAFLGDALGNVIAHEAGHFFGNWHTDQFNDHADLMDSAGGFPTLFGVGPDGVGGTADDVDVDFGEDRFNTAEGFTGTEHTLGRVAFGITT